MDEDEYKDFDSDNTSDPDGFDDEEMSDDESFFARPGEQQQEGASSISSQVRCPFLSRPSSPWSVPQKLPVLTLCSNTCSWDVDRTRA